MRRCLPVLACLLSAAPSHAFTVFVRPPTTTPYTPEKLYLVQEAFTGIMERLGGSYAVIDWGACTTDGLRDGKIYHGRRWVASGGGNFREQDVDCWVVAWQPDLFSFQSGCFPDSLTLAAGWGKKPVVFLNLATNAGLVNQAGGTPDSTGITSSPSFDSYRDRYRVQLNGSTEVWTMQGTHPQVSNTARGPGIWRPVVSAAVATGTANQTVETCASCDDPAGDLATAATDSVLLWARYRSALEPAPLVFAQHSATGALINGSIIAMALAMADSASGGKVFDLAAKRGPAQIGVYVAGGIATARYSSYLGGVFCAADSCDSTNLKAARDSLANLRPAYTPFRFTVGADPESSMVLTWLKRIWEAAPNVKFAPEPRSGAIDFKVPLDVARAHRLYDPLGYTRARTIWRSGQSTLWACAENDSDEYCMLKATMARMDSLYVGRVDHALVGYDEDWLNVGLTKNSARLADTLGIVMQAVGIRAVVTAPDRVEANLALVDAASNALSISPTQSVWWLPNGRPIRVLRSRGLTNWSPRGALTFVQTHSMACEFLQGFFMSRWYVAATANPNNRFFKGQPSPHLFDVPLEVFSVSASALGGAGQGTTPRRPGWYQVKWLVNQVSAINRLAGRKLIEFAYLEDIR